MSILATALTVASSSVGTIAVKWFFDTLTARRADAAKKSDAAIAAEVKRTEVEITAETTLKTKAIDDAAELRGELWERIEKLETRSDACARENVKLLAKVTERDAVITQLTHEIRKARAQALAAEKMCEAMRDELDEMRRSVA